ncbi:hypothetical protein BH10CHL1_BH10CHL1_28780 [soil metagenome]
MHPFFWLTILLLVIVALWACSLALAQADITPPVLVNLHLEPAQINPANAKQQIRVTAHFTDDFSGLYYASILFAPVTGTVQSHEVQFFRNNRISGTAKDGIYAHIIELPQHAAPGLWVIVELAMIDQAGNRTQCYGLNKTIDDQYWMHHVANGKEAIDIATATPTDVLSQPSLTAIV